MIWSIQDLFSTSLTYLMSETGVEDEGERWCVVVPVWLEKTAEGVVVRTSDGEVVMEMEVGWRRMCATERVAVCDGVGGGVRRRLGLRTMMEGGGRCGDGDGDGDGSVSNAAAYHQIITTILTAGWPA
ncbi:hypothetical protein Hanom_Chr16g01495081 [Helianthus anomalus]